MDYILPMPRFSKANAIRTGTSKLIAGLTKTKKRFLTTKQPLPDIFFKEKEVMFQRQMFGDLVRSKYVIDSMRILFELPANQAKNSHVRKALNAVIDSKFENYFLLSKYKNLLEALKKQKVKLTLEKAQKLLIEIKGTEGAVMLFRKFLENKSAETLVSQVLSKRRDKTAVEELASIFAEQGLAFCKDFFVTANQLEKVLAGRIQ